MNSNVVFKDRVPLYYHRWWIERSSIWERWILKKESASSNSDPYFILIPCFVFIYDWSTRVRRNCFWRILLRRKSRFSTSHKPKPMLVGLRISQHFIVLLGTPGCSTWYHKAFRVFQTMSDPLQFFQTSPKINGFYSFFSDIFESLWCIPGQVNPHLNHLVSYGFRWDIP